MSQEAFAQLEPSGASLDRPRSVLIIEDDESQSTVLARRLEEQGYAMLVARTGQEGLVLARRLQPSLILLDIKLPDMEGFDVCAQLNDNPSTCTIPIIMVSGHEEANVIRRARSVGCVYYVRKPYDPSVLLLLVRDALERTQRCDW